ncbi:type II toxin-antitoxin system RelE/ParE family toxin [Candidatus Dependentiae bacterium]|nr:type II toxin-antitoxin system RelE/ParE family toxin [Candidatus Dependentiae bacterium]
MDEKEFSVCFYSKANNQTPVEIFLDSLNTKEQQKIVAHIKLLEKYGNKLERPYSAYLRDKIYELRIKVSRNQYRIFYFFYLDKKIILTNAMIKKTDEIPIQEIEKAVSYMNDFITRYKRGDIKL